MKSVFAMAPVILGLVFGLGLQESIGAILLGITGLIVDNFLLWLRVEFLRRVGTSIRPVLVIGGFYLRVINVAIFLLVGAWWLVSGVQPLFHWIIITIPLWNLLSAAKISGQY